MLSGFLLSLMTRVVSIVSILLIGIVIARGQQPVGNIVDDGDKTGIIESVLALEKRNQDLEMPNQSSMITTFRHVSSENIEFIEPSRLSTPGFRIVSVAFLNRVKQEYVVDYLLFREISLRDGIATVVLSRVSEGRPCFAAPISSERRFRYKARRSPVGWVAELLRPTPPTFFTGTPSGLFR